MTYDSSNLLAEKCRKTKGYAGIEKPRINYIKFKPLQTVRLAWLDRYCGDDDTSDGWDEDVEADVDNIGNVRRSRTFRGPVLRFSGVRRDFAPS